MNSTERKALRAAKPDVWIPVESGDHIEGKVKDLTAAWSDVQYKDGDPESGLYPLLRLDVIEAAGYKDDVRELAVHAFAAVLQDRLITQEPAPGERIIITYDGTGEKKTRGRSAPELYTVELPDRDPTVAAGKVWGQFKGRRGRAGAPDPDVPIDAGDLPDAA